ncbi:MAG: hypothetical protein LH481_15335 [Burkholderiales bacterium]|nr:hypothetical protein [Burkholderiales bacterium]
MITTIAPRSLRAPLALAARRAALLVRIHAARAETADISRHLAGDLRATEHTRRAILGGWKIFKASVLAAGVIWSFNATSRLARGRRFLTLAFSALSTIRAMRRLGTFLLPLTQSFQRQG